jgi:hypothetical protein
MPISQLNSGLNRRVQAMMLERQYNARLLLRCRSQWLSFVQAAQQQRKDAASIERKKTEGDSGAREPQAELEAEESGSDASQSSQRCDAEDLVRAAGALGLEEQNVFKRVFNSKMRENERSIVDAIDLTETDASDRTGGGPSRDTPVVMIFPQDEPAFNSLCNLSPTAAASREKLDDGAATFGGDASGDWGVDGNEECGGDRREEAEGVAQQDVPGTPPSACAEQSSTPENLFVPETEEIVDYYPHNEPLPQPSSVDYEMLSIELDASAIHMQPATQQASYCSSRSSSRGADHVTQDLDPSRAVDSPVGASVDSPAVASSAEAAGFEDADAIAAALYSSSALSRMQSAPDAEPSAAIMPRRIGPKTPLSPPPAAAGAAAVNTAAYYPQPSPAAADAESSLVVEPHRVVTKACLSPSHDLQPAVLGASTAGSVSTAEFQLVSAPLQPISNSGIRWPF